MGALDGRVAIITGAGRGLGREHARLFASEGAEVVVNDLGGAADGSGGDATPAQQVVDEIEAMGGAAIANGDNVAEWEGAQRLVQAAIDRFGDICAKELSRYGVRSNAIAPAARTRLTEATPGLGDVVKAPEDAGQFDLWDPANVSPFVAYLATADRPFNGETFLVRVAWCSGSNRGGCRRRSTRPTGGPWASSSPRPGS
jgi:NAD(P)-dependent dehydrogenase (short-subunit alcohol dehydrogenase family)